MGTDENGAEATTGIIKVYAPALEVETPVEVGQCAATTGSGWLPNSEVTLQLTDAEGNPVGDPVVVTTDAEGNLPADTCVTVPEGTEPGDYAVVGTDENGAEVSTPVTVGAGSGGSGGSGDDGSASGIGGGNGSGSGNPIDDPWNSNGDLAHTGVDVPSLLSLALLLIVAGGLTFAFDGRRRKRGGAHL
ncbi:hypothetical protein [Cumulibacter soli]|uniref:hypothetical protein n=1 Tax=Cumulibacter soli TaxID=2546344 RepID=UPI001ABB2B68|nr:hypothetical protein [Cumulibacter soli]